MKTNFSHPALSQPTAERRTLSGVHSTFSLVHSTWNVWKPFFPFCLPHQEKSCRRLRFSFSSRFRVCSRLFDRQTNTSLFANLRLEPFTPSILQAKARQKAASREAYPVRPTLLCEWKWKFFFFLSQQIFSKEKEENGKESGCSEFLRLCFMKRWLKCFAKKWIWKYLKLLRNFYDDSHQFLIKSVAKLVEICEIEKLMKIWCGVFVKALSCFKIRRRHIWVVKFASKYLITFTWNKIFSTSLQAFVFDSLIQIFLKQLLDILSSNFCFDELCCFEMFSNGMNW